jgi:aspartyl-tRNA(Asn)/glutamyl-tRNA(Gln) amidotransferase subunit A
MGSLATDPDGPFNVDAPVAQRLREAGTVLLGKTTSPEYGWKGVTDSGLYGTTHNPWKIDRTPGGSSGGGTAAEAVGMGNLAIGTDGAGSVRIPCSFSGIFGLKPTQARVPLWPVSAQGTLSHVGPMTRTVRDAAMMMNVIARPDPRDPYGRPDDAEDYLKGFDKGVKGLRIAYSPHLGFVERDKIDRDVAVAVEQAVKVFKTLGAKIVEDSPDFMGLDPRKVLNAHWQSNVAILVKNFSEEKRAMMDPGLLKAAEHGAHPARRRS